MREGQKIYGDILGKEEELNGVFQTFSEVNH